MMKLIVSDLDGTLLPAGADRVSEDVFAAVRQITEGGSIFAIASGRPYSGLKHLLAPVADQIVFIASDGALTVYKNEVLEKYPIERMLGVSFMTEIYCDTEAEIVLYSDYLAYLKPKSACFLEEARSTLYNHVVQVKCMEKEAGDCLKIGVMHKEGVRERTEKVIERYENQFHLTCSSKEWLEFTAAGVHKGKAVRALQRRFSISKAETVVFGDNRNDMEMFEQSDFAYAMADADPSVKEKAGYQTQNVVSTLNAMFY